MEREYRTVDKAAWPDGPWQTEPDKIQYVDEATGLPCLVKRHARGGHLCGYVGVPPGHPAHGRHYDGVEVEVHGGLTYAAGCQHDAPEAEGICHVPAPDEPDDVWWLGFDCAHGWDYQPGMEAVNVRIGYPSPPGAEDSYRTVEYVREQNTLLAAQLQREGN